MTWLEDSARTPVADVATRLGYELRRAVSADTCPCPACGAERRHAGRGDRRGAVGIPRARPSTWHCFACDAAGDSVDFVAYRLHTRRFRELDAGQKAAVRDWFGGLGVTTTRPRMQAEPPPNYPPADEVAALWASCMPVTDAAQVAGYLAFRGIPAHGVAHLDLARALPSGADVPPWAHLGERTWGQSMHRLIVPLWDARGSLRSLLARSIERQPFLKSAGASGYARAGLVMADRLARSVLERGRAPAWWVGRVQVVIREGEVDWLDESSRPWRPSQFTFGIVSGSWTMAHAKRLPIGAHVVIATDDDQAGDKYAATIATTLDELGIAHERRRDPATRTA